MGDSAAQRKGSKAFAEDARSSCQKLKKLKPEGKDLGAYVDGLYNL